MRARPQHSAFSVDLSRLHRRTVTSFYSNLVTRPTGRAVRMGLEQQLVHFGATGGPCLSILDFTQVRVLDYSCADEIVAKLLMRYTQGDRPVDAYFIARGLHDHHLESVEAVLERHRLLLAVEVDGGEPALLGPSDEVERTCWSMLVRRGEARPHDIVSAGAIASHAARPGLSRLIAARVVVTLPGDRICPVPCLADA